MKALFNCSVIKNVYLRNDTNIIELEVTYLDELDRSWLYKTNISDLAHKDYAKGIVTTAYETIKNALLKNITYVEVEL
jgi:hypothetical protein